MTSASDLISDGVCDATCTLRDALQVANHGDIIAFSPAFDQRTTLTLQAALPILSDVEIRGPGVTRLTIDGQFFGRIFEVGATSNVLISDLAMTRGGAGGFAGQPDGQGGDVEGACIRGESGVLRLSRVSIRDCRSQSGKGGDGSPGQDDLDGTQEGGGQGNAGGDGGAARGGAIYHGGELRLERVSITDIEIYSGDGGAGGTGGAGYFDENAINDTIGGNGGDGGWGGALQGAAIFADRAILQNVAIHDIRATTGVGGAAGVGGVGGFGPGADGIEGAVNDLLGGVIRTVSGGTIAFSTIESGQITLTSTGNYDARILSSQGTTVVHRSVFLARGSTLPGANNFCAGALTTNQLLTEVACGPGDQVVTPLPYGDDLVVRQGYRFRPMLFEHPGRDASLDCNDPLSAAVTTDLIGTPRPTDVEPPIGTQCDLGAEEFGGTLFLDGFE